MALSTATISYDIADLIGTDFETRRTKVWVSTNIADGTVIDTVGNAIRVDTGQGTLAADGTGSVTVWTPGTGSNPDSWQTYVHLDYASPMDRTRKRRTFGPFTVTTSANLADLVEEQEVPAEYLTTITAALDAYADSAAASASEAESDADRAEAAADLALDVSGIATPDALVAALVANPASDTSDALVASDALAASFARVAGVATATQVQATDTASIAAAIATLPTTGAVVGGTVYLPPGQWLINAPLSLLQGLHFKGAGKASTEIRVQTGSMFAPATPIGFVTFEDLTLSTVGAHLFNFGTTGGLYESRLISCTLVTYINGASLMKQDGTGDIVEVVFDNCEFNRPATATVPAFDLKNSGGALNANEWRNCRAVGNDCTSTPFFYLEGTLAAYAHDNKFKGIVGHGNRGGLIHVYSPNGVTFEDCQDWDAGGNYVDHLIKVATSATSGGVVPRGVRASNVGTRFGTFDAGKYPFSGPTVPDNPYILDRIGDTTGSGVLPYVLGQSIRDASGVTGSINFVGSNYTCDWDIDGTVVANGSSLTVTLPAPTATPYAGRRFTVKNLHSTSLTVNATGGATLDGAASVALAQWAVKTFTTDGGTWFSV